MIMLMRLLVLCLALSTIPAMTGCGPKKATPEMCKSFLKLRGYRFTRDEFFRAIKGEDSLIINGFIDAGMDSNSKNNAGMTALTYAIQNTGIKTVRILARKADINLKDDQGNGPLHIAIIRDNEEMVELLLKARAYVNVTGKDEMVTNQSPLFAALLKDDMKLFKRLLDLGADPNIADSGGAFPLSEACVRNGATVEPIKMLLDKGAEINKVEKNGASALTYAAQNSAIDAATRKAIVNLLIEKGADKSLRDNTGKTASDWARETGHPEMVEILK